MYDYNLYCKKSSAMCKLHEYLPLINILLILINNYHRYI